MSDDVKVKFGGDFSDIAKGASEAVNKAGASMTAWFNDFSKSTESSVLSALSLQSIFGKLVDGMSAVLKTSKELDNAFQRFGTGGRAREFQVLARYGQEVGVSMEAVGRTMNYFSKVQDAAKKGNEAHVTSLKSLGFTSAEIKAGNISAIEVLRRMSDMYDQTGNAALVGQKAVQLFGLQGEQLAGVYKNGKIALDEFNKSAVTVSEEANRRLAKTQRNIDQLKRGGEGIFMGIGGFLGGLSRSYEFSSKMGENLMQARESSEKPEQRGKTLANLALSDFSGSVEDMSDAIKWLREYASNGLTTREDSKMAIIAANRMEASLKSQEERLAEEAKKKATPPLLENVRVMAASSLQSIGGGDIGSIMSGTYQTSMLDAATKTADNTGKLLDNQTNRPLPKPASVAK